MIDCEKEIQNLRDELLKASEEIKKLSRIKADFISVVSHELRTPITSIKESVSLILEGIAGPLNEEQKKFLTIAKNNIDRLARLIIDILDMSKLEAGRVVMHKRKSNINELIKDVYASMKIEAEQKNVEFNLFLEEPIELAWFDPDRIGHVLKSLISNAIKFNRDKRKINIYSSKEDVNGKDVVKIIVEDNGIGIPPEDVENLFRNLSPLDTSITRKYGGMGLSLTISKGIIELHGGNIWVISEPDMGTKFIFTIPIAPQKVLLIIDDEEDLTSMLSFRLKNMGFDIFTACDGNKGIESAKKNKPDLILLDLMMPDMDGYEVSKRLKSDSDTKHIPILIFSALGNKNTQESMQKLGAAGFIEKPFEPEDLVKKIDNVLEARNG
jgi:CheY-like chemotaxis protein